MQMFNGLEVLESDIILEMESGPTQLLDLLWEVTLILTKSQETLVKLVSGFLGLMKNRYVLMDVLVNEIHKNYNI